MRTSDDWLDGIRPRRGDGENPWRTFALDVQRRLREARSLAHEANVRARDAEQAARSARARVVALRERGGDFHRLLQLAESAVRQERRALADVERLLEQGDVPAVLELLAARRRTLERIGVVS